MALKNLLNLIFNTNRDSVYLNDLYFKRVNNARGEEYSFLNTETFIEFLYTGKASIESKYWFQSFLEDNFELTNRPSVGDLFVVRDSKNDFIFYLEGILSKEEEGEKYLTFKSGVGLFAPIETLKLSDAKGYAYKGRHFEFYKTKGDNPLTKPLVKDVNYVVKGEISDLVNGLNVA
jgi:hypothetical protein